MGDEIKPAMTAEEWRRLETAPMEQPDPEEWSDPLEGGVRLYGDEVRVYAEGGFRYEIADRHKAAALCLHGQTFGFSWEDVDELRLQSRCLPGRLWQVSDHYNDLADRIAALLPPREIADTFPEDDTAERMNRHNPEDWK